jgi:predicted regulator of Ras-like GTPase activity (Roadblock/LC7/MglB family)
MEGTNGTSITPSTVRKTPAGQRTDLPSWLIDQPTQFEVKALRPSSLNATGHIPVTPVVRPSPIVRRPVQSLSNPRTTDDLSGVEQPAGASLKAARLSVASRAASPVSAAVAPATFGESRVETPVDVLLGVPEEKAQREPAPGQEHRRNYLALVSALQTVGYTLPGFIAAALVSMDGKPIAEVTVDGLDISSLCGNFNTLLRGTLQALDGGAWGQHEHTIITSATHHILLRVPANSTDVFQVLVTTRESDPVESLDVLVSVEGAIVSAL